MTNKKECAGSYSVSGYTRTDGVEVSGYTRTCGAAHNSNSSDGKTLCQEEKMLRRADILYGNNEEYTKKYYDGKKNTEFTEKYEKNILETSGNYNPDKLNKSEQIKINNFYFSNEEIIRARKFIQGEEDFREGAYKPTANDVWTIGYGHTGYVDGKPVTAEMKITKEKAEELYRKDFEAHIQPLKEIEVPLTNNQKIALASFSYNIGVNGFRKSGIFKALQNGDYQTAAEKFEEYVKQKDKKTGKVVILKGLVKRRKREKELFLTPDKE